MNIIKKVFNKIRNIYLTQKYGFKGKNIRFGKNVEIPNPQYIKVGNNVSLRNNVELYCFPDLKEIVPSIEIGNNILLQKGVTIGCANKIILEDNVTLAGNIHISDRDKIYENIEVLIVNQGTKSKGPIHIKRGSWLGYGVQVMSGVTIGKHCVIAAGSIVTKSIPDYTVAGGIPAKPLLQYNRETKTWDKVK